MRYGFKWHRSSSTICARVTTICFGVSFLAFLSANTAHAGTISTFAGGGVGDGGQALKTFVVANYIGADAKGNLFLTDFKSQRIRKVSPTGIVTTVAGSGLGSDLGVGAFAGDGGLATNARLNFPMGIVVASDGTIFFADSENARIRKIDVNGLITTIAGTGIDGYGGDGGSATSAKFSKPKGVAIDAQQNIYVADTGNNAIRKISASGAIETVAGNGVAGFGGDGSAAVNAELRFPYDVAVDDTGALFIADLGNNRIRKVSLDGAISTIAGLGAYANTGDGGPAASAQAYQPSSLSFDSQGGLLFVAGNEIRKISPSGTITRFAGNARSGVTPDGGLAIDAVFMGPSAVFAHGENVYIGDAQVRKVDANGVLSTAAGILDTNMGEGLPAEQAQFNGPNGMAMDADANLYIADFQNHCVRKISNHIVSTVAGMCTEHTSGFSGDGGPAKSAKLSTPLSLALDRAGNLYINDFLNAVIRKVSTSGIITTVAGNGIFGHSGDGGPATKASLNYPETMTVDTQGNLLITEESAIRKVTSSGTITTFAGNTTGQCSRDTQLVGSAAIEPGSLFFDAAGNLIFSDALCRGIRKISPDGMVSMVAGKADPGYSSGDGGAALDATFYQAGDLSTDRAGNIYVIDQGTVRKISTNGIISTVAGKGDESYSGDGGPATFAGLNRPSATVVDAEGRLYISDYSSNVIRQVVPDDGFISVYPARLLDTRAGALTADGLFAGIGALNAQTSMDLAILGRGGVPMTKATAVVLNITATGPTTEGFVTAWPSGIERPRASNLNFVAGATVANQAIVKLGQNGQVTLFNSAGQTQLIVDVMGYFTDDAAYVPLSPARFMDTRAGASTIDGRFAGVGALMPKNILAMDVSGRNGLPSQGIGTAVLNVTATNTTANGFIDVWASDQSRPSVSSLNFSPARTAANLAISQLSGDGRVSFFNSAGSTDLIADVVGWFPATSELLSVRPSRLLDTRYGTTTIDGRSQAIGSLTAKATVVFPVGGRALIPLRGVGAAVLNVTVTSPTANGFLSVWPAGSPRPLSSNINFSPGQTIANMVIVNVGADAQVSVFNSAGTTDVIIDVVGWFPTPL